MFYFLDSPATLMLMLVIGLVTGYALNSRPDLTEKLAFRPRLVLSGKQYYRLGTAWLVHGGLGHLALNLFTLFAFGRYLEALIGTPQFLAVFFGAELAANGLTLLMQKDSASYGSVGASGAISGVLFAYSLYRPMDYIYLFGVVPMPAWIFAVLFVGLSIAAMKKSGARGGIAHEAHLGGALGGILITILLNPGVLGIFRGQMGF
ncbi:MAG: membrane associated rhomboid family serine protease [Rhodothermales bacterium]|jgi:membrane associated rhomboid family serine protease